VHRSVEQVHDVVQRHLTRVEGRSGNVNVNANEKANEKELWTPASNPPSPFPVKSNCLSDDVHKSLQNRTPLCCYRHGDWGFEQGRQGVSDSCLYSCLGFSPGSGHDFRPERG
jgi:hypothetical protein